MPDAVTVMDWVVAPLLQVLPVAALDVSVTLPPSQKVVAPDVLTVGVAGTGFTVTVTGVEAADWQLPFVTYTE